MNQKHRYKVLIEFYVETDSGKDKERIEDTFEQITTEILERDFSNDDMDVREGAAAAMKIKLRKEE